MNKLFNKIASGIVGIALAIGVGVAVGSGAKEARSVKAESATVTFADAGWSNGYKPESATLGGFDFVFTKVSGSNPPAYYTSDSTLRFYNKCTMTVSKAGYSITNVVCSPAASSGEVSDDSFVCTFTATIRVKSVSITYSSGSTTPTVNSVSVDPTTLDLDLNGSSSGTITPTVSVSGGAAQTVNWSVENANPAGCVTVDNGEVTAVATGTATVRATSTVDSTKYADCSVTVVDTTPPEGSETITMSVADYASSNNWQNDTQYLTMVLSQYVTISIDGGSNSGKYYTSGSNWRMYQSESPQITFTGSSGTTINSIKITYAVSNSGVLLDASDNHVQSGDVVLVGANSYTFGVGNSGSATNGQVRITDIVVNYNPGSDVSTYTLTYDKNTQDTVTGMPSNVSDLTSGTYTLDSESTPSRSGYSFDGWASSADSHTPITTVTISNADVTVYAIWTEILDEHSDLINKAFTGNPSSYTNWTGTGTSGAIYSGNSNGSNDSVQLRSESPSGIVVRQSPGYIEKIKVVWESNTASGRTLNIYGKNTPYFDSSELYDENSRGTLLGTIVYGTSTEFVLTGNYRYVGLASSSGAMYLTSIVVKWTDAQTSPLVAVSKSSVSLKTSETAGAAIEALVQDVETPTYSWSASSTDVVLEGANTSLVTIKPNTQNDASVVVTLTVGGVSPSLTATVNVEITAPGPGETIDNPFNISQALNHIDDVVSGGTSSGDDGNIYYAKGIVSEIITEYDTTHKNITFDIVDEEGDETALRAYRCGGSQASEVLVGDTVIVSGNLTIYNNSIYEFTQGCELESLTHPEQPAGTGTVVFSRSGSTDSITSGYTKILTNYSGKTGYYQDNATGIDIGFKKEDGSALWTTTSPNVMTLTAKIGGGSAKDPLTNNVVAYFLDSNFEIIEASATDVTTKTESTTGTDYTIEMPATTNVYGLMIHHEKETSYNVRLFGFTFTFETEAETYTAADFASDFKTALYGTSGICDAGGNTNFTSLQAKWIELAGKFDTLSAEDKALYKDNTQIASASQDIKDTVELYDYIATKYGHTLEKEGELADFDFMDRGITPRSSGRISIFGNMNRAESNTILVVVIASVISVAAIGGYFFLKKKKEK